MRRYIDNAIFWDFLLATVIGTCLFLFKPVLKVFFTLPKVENIFSFGILLITISATLLGFLLTIITVIVTFKKGFDDKSDNKSDNDIIKTDIPKTTVFDRPISKETKFYGTQIHKSVVNVFINSTSEIGMIILIVLIMQFNIISTSLFILTIINFCVFIILSLSIIRCLFIFRLFLKVHIHESSLEKFK